VGLLTIKFCALRFAVVLFSRQFFFVVAMVTSASPTRTFVVCRSLVALPLAESLRPLQPLCSRS
jgi:hypothetical protein